MKTLLIATVLTAVVAAPMTRADDHGRGGRDSDWHRDGRHGEGYFTPHFVPRGREFHDLPDGFIRLFLGGLELYYWEGMYYQRAGDHFVVVPAPVGAVVTALPEGVPPVIVDGVPYYTVNGVTYMYTSVGYQVVPPPRVILAAPPATATPIVAAPPIAPAPPTVATPPTVAAPPTPPAEDIYTVNIPNAKGTYTPVTLKRSGNGFVGPQGEYYPEFPRVEQLKVMYGK